MVAVKKNQTKSADSKKIQSRITELKRIYSTLPSNKKNIVNPLIEQAAFIEVQLTNLEKKINGDGVVDKYSNGATQSGQKISANLQAYNGLIKSYSIVSKRLEELLPPEQRKSKLKEFTG
jgi:hypothetical protein